MPDDDAATLQKLTDVFRSVFGDPSLQLRPEMTAADFPRWDSLNNVKLILACERAFNIRVRPRDINGLENIAAFLGHLRSRQAKR